MGDAILLALTNGPHTTVSCFTFSTVCSIYLNFNALLTSVSVVVEIATTIGKITFQYKLTRQLYMELAT